MTIESHAPAHGDLFQTPGSATRTRSAGRPRSPAVSREAITRAVVDLICERGLMGWSMRDLATRLGVSTGTVTHYFPDKQTLLSEAMDSVYVLPGNWERQRNLPHAEQLRQMTEMFVLNRERLRQWSRFWLEYLAGAARDAALQGRQEERYERQRRFFARLIAAGIAAQEFAPRLDAEREAERLIALGSGLAVQQLASPAHLSPAAARAILDLHLAELKHGLDRGREEV